MNQNDKFMPEKIDMGQGDRIWRVRTGPDYYVNKRKIQSGAPLMNLKMSSLYGSTKKIDNISQYFDNKQICGNPDKNKLLIVFNTQAPHYAPTNPVWETLWGGSYDGPGYSLINFFQFTDESYDDFIKDVPTNPSIRLFKKFMYSDPNDMDMYNRLKIIPKISDMSECDHISDMTKSYLDKYSETPFLARPQYSTHLHKDGDIDVFEIDMDIHRFRYVVRLCFQEIIDIMPTFSMEYSFLIEGKTEDELLFES